MQECLTENVNEEKGLNERKNQYNMFRNIRDMIFEMHMNPHFNLYEHEHHYDYE